MPSESAAQSLAVALPNQARYGCCAVTESPAMRSCCLLMCVHLGASCYQSAIRKNRVCVCTPCCSCENEGQLWGVGSLSTVGSEVEVRPLPTL